MPPGQRSQTGNKKNQQLALAASKAKEAAIKPQKDKSAAPSNDVVIDVIVAYTKKAASNYSDVKRELVDLSIEEANESFRQSGIGHVKLRLVHAYQTDYVEEGTHFDHVWRFADKGDGYMEEIHPAAQQVSRGRGCPRRRRSEGLRTGDARVRRRGRGLRSGASRVRGYELHGGA